MGFLNWTKLIKLIKLINFEYKFTFYHNDNFIQVFDVLDVLDVLSKHKSLQNIKLSYSYTCSYNEIYTNINIFDEIINLSQTKSNSIFITLCVFKWCLNKPNFIEFKKIVDKTEQLYNIKLNFASKYSIFKWLWDK